MPDAAAPTPLSNAQLVLRGLEQERQDAKAREDAAKKERLDIEQQILHHPDFPSLKLGTNKLDFVTVAKTEQRDWDQVALNTYREEKHPEPAMWPFSAVWKEDKVVMQYLRQNYPGYADQLEELALTIKARKPSFTALKENQ